VCHHHADNRLLILYRFAVSCGLLPSIRGNPVTEVLPTRAVASPQQTPQAKSELRAVAEKLEASFLAEMLKSAGVGEQENSFSGSTGESHFATFQRVALAREMVASGGIGLADIFQANLKEKTNDQ